MDNFIGRDDLINIITNSETCLEEMMQLNNAMLTELEKKSDSDMFREPKAIKRIKCQNDEGLLYSFYSCPTCGRSQVYDNAFDFCPYCGQALDWSGVK